MIYLDTSVVVALLTPEERSAQALDWFGQSREPLISSDWLITETHSALGIKQRHHGLSSGARQAADLLQDPGLGLRAGDAILALNTTEVKSPGQFNDLVAKLDDKKPVALLVKREDAPARYLTLRPDAK